MLYIHTLVQTEEFRCESGFLLREGVDSLVLCESFIKYHLGLGVGIFKWRVVRLGASI